LEIAMSKKKPTPTPASIPTRTPHAQLAAEAAAWDHGPHIPAAFEIADEAVPRAKEATAISLRLPNTQLAVLKKFAEREGTGYQVLLKRWLDDRIRLERDRLRQASSAARSTRPRPRAPQFPLRDRAGDASHYASEPSGTSS
jgi:cation diffusion facilitator CzcD-associated flavoprotein CzcO